MRYLCDKQAIPLTQNIAHYVMQVLILEKLKPTIDYKSIITNRLSIM